MSYQMLDISNKTMSHFAFMTPLTVYQLRQLHDRKVVQSVRPSYRGQAGIASRKSSIVLSAAVAMLMKRG